MTSEDDNYKFADLPDVYRYLRGGQGPTSNHPRINTTNQFKETPIYIGPTNTISPKSCSYIQTIACQDHFQRPAAAEAQFVATLQIEIKKQNKVQLQVEEGWYSRDEMVNELGWSEILVFVNFKLGTIYSMSPTARTARTNVPNMLSASRKKADGAVGACRAKGASHVRLGSLPYAS